MFNAILGNASQLNSKTLTEQYGWLLANNEGFQVGFMLIRDLFVLTNFRLIFINKQGITGHKMEVMSIPYKRIIKFSVESAGTFDFDSELKIWIQGQSEPIVNKFRKDYNIKEVYRILSNFVIQN